MTDKELLESLELLSHKLKNPLHSVGINLDVLRVKLKKEKISDKAIYKHLDIVENESHRIQEIVIKFSKYIKMSDAKKKMVNLRKLLEGK